MTVTDPVRDEDAWLAEGELLSAATVSTRVGKSLRTVQGWFGQGLPCRTETRRGQPCRVTTLRAVREWARREGIALGAEKPAPGSREAAPLVAAAEDARALSESLFETRVAAEVEKRLEDLVGDPDYDVRIVRMRKLIAQMFRIPETQLFEAAEASQAATALKNASTELRQLEAEAIERRARRIELLEHVAVAKAVTSATDVWNSHRDAAPSKVASAVGADVEASIAGLGPDEHPSPEAIARVAMAATERVMGEIFTQIAGCIISLPIQNGAAA